MKTQKDITIANSQRKGQILSDDALEKKKLKGHILSEEEERQR